MMTEKMELRLLSSTSALILALLVNETTSNVKIVDALYGLQQKGTKKYADSPLHCINECLRRACCMEVGYQKMKVGLKPYTCMFKCSNSTEMNDPGLCESRLVLIHKVPTVLAGACQDHRCKWKEVCVGKRTGGYTCRGGYET